MEMHAQLINQDKLNQLGEQVGKEMVPVVLATFIAEGQQIVEQLAKLQGNDLRRCCHTLKSSAAAVGAEPLSNEAARLDAKLKENPLACIDVNQLILIYNDSLIALRSYLK